MYFLGAGLRGWAACAAAARVPGSVSPGLAGSPPSHVLRRPGILSTGPYLLENIFYIKKLMCSCKNKHLWLFYYVHCIVAVLRIRIRDPVPFWPLDPDPGSGIGFFPDLGSRIPTPYFLELSDKFLGKKFYNSLKNRPNFFLQHLKNKIIFNFVKFVATKKRFDNNFFSPLSFVAVFGSGIRNG